MQKKLPLGVACIGFFITKLIYVYNIESVPTMQFLSIVAKETPAQTLIHTLLQLPLHFALSTLLA